MAATEAQSQRANNQNALKRESALVFLGFALSECTIKVDADSVKYLRAVHRTALELAIYNRFGAEIGGFWLTTDQIAQLRALSDYYPPKESPYVAQAIEAYLQAQSPTWIKYAQKMSNQ